MKKIYFIISICILFVGCSKSVPEEKIVEGLNNCINAGQRYLSIEKWDVVGKDFKDPLLIYQLKVVVNCNTPIGFGRFIYGQHTYGISLAFKKFGDEYVHVSSYGYEVRLME